MTAERDRLIERRDLVQRDLDELTAQVDDGEIDPETAQRLRSAYTSELGAIEASLGNLPDEEPEADAATEAIDPASEAADPATRRRSPRRMVVGSLIVIAALTAAIAFAARDTGAAAGGPGALTVDPESVSNDQLEAIVAANPDVIGMRMALADRYFDAEEYGSSMDHYLYIAANAPEQVDESKALARIGWMAYITNLPEAADEYLQAALRVDPSNAEALLFRGFVTLYGLEDPGAAIPQLEAALELTNLSPNVVKQVEDALVDARQGVAP